MANRIFFVLMGLSSALALLRGLVLAAILPVDGFGRYAMLFAIGTFAASLLSFGLIERSLKRFSRLCADGHLDSAFTEADLIARSLALRALLVAVATVGLMLAAGLTAWLVPGLLALGVALSAGLQSTYISLQRSDGELRGMGLTSLARALLALMMGLAGASLYGWIGALFGEIAGGLLGGLLSRQFMVRKLSASAQRLPSEGLPPIEAPQRELWTFVGFLGAAVPLYLDRTIVTALLGHAATGTYAMLMLFVMGAYTATGIVSQKLGPQLVHMQRLRAGSRAQVLLLARWSTALAAIGFCGMLVVGWLLLSGPLQYYGVRYDLGWSLLVPVAVLAGLQITHLLEWFVLAHDREYGVMAGSAALLLVLTVGVVMAVFRDGDLTWLLWTFAVAKVCQLLTLSCVVLIAASPARGKAAKTPDFWPVDS